MKGMLMIIFIALVYTVFFVWKHWESQGHRNIWDWEWKGGKLGDNANVKGSKYLLGVGKADITG
jgi:hypothetical protein